MPRHVSRVCENMEVPEGFELRTFNRYGVSQYSLYPIADSEFANLIEADEIWSRNFKGMTYYGVHGSDPSAVHFLTRLKGGPGFWASCNQSFTGRYYIPHAQYASELTGEPQIGLASDLKGARMGTKLIVDPTTGTGTGVSVYIDDVNCKRVQPEKAFSVWHRGIEYEYPYYQDFEGNGVEFAPPDFDDVGSIETRGAKVCSKAEKSKWLNRLRFLRHLKWGLKYANTAGVVATVHFTKEEANARAEYYEQTGARCVISPSLDAYAETWGTAALQAIPVGGYAFVFWSVALPSLDPTFGATPEDRELVLKQLEEEAWLALNECAQSAKPAGQLPANYVGLTVAVDSPLRGTVNSRSGKILCGFRGNKCTELYQKFPSREGDARFYTETLYETPENRGKFIQWSGVHCQNDPNINSTTYTGDHCEVLMDKSYFVTAKFDRPVKLNVAKVSSGGSVGDGTVTSTPSGISCGSDCDEEYDKNAIVSLLAVPNDNSRFVGWLGPCSNSSIFPQNVCNVTMDSDKSVIAIFASQFTLSVSKTGSGYVSSSDGKITCGFDCSKKYDGGATVTLTATPYTGVSTFGSWTGCDTTSGFSCAVTMDRARTVTANFNNLPVYSLNVTVVGAGGPNLVTSTPSGISCEGDCNDNYSQGTTVILRALPPLGTTFVNWTGCTSSLGLTCTVLVTSNRSITARFNTAPKSTLSVSKNGSGTGTVTSTPGYINCGNSCSDRFSSGSTVTLNAVASLGSQFSSWSGCDSAVGGACTVNITTSNKNVTATFATITTGFASKGN